VSQRDGTTRTWSTAYDIRADDAALGLRFIPDELRDAALTAGDAHQVARLCSQRRIWSVLAKEPRLNRRPRRHGRPRLHRSAAAPNRLWPTDVTEHPTARVSPAPGSGRDAIAAARRHRGALRS
jgi:putative transposase